jgi:membrane protease YdiL (CAAX protease family)
MNAPAVAQPTPSSPQLIAPLWHTGLFLLALGALATWGTHRHGLPAFGASRAAGYVMMIVFEWLLFALAAWGMWLGGISIKCAIGGRWAGPVDFLRDLGIGITFLLGSNVILIGLSAVLRPGPNANVSRILPHSGTEITLWIFLSFSAGICEEFTNRGYLQKQLSGLLKNVSAGVVAQGVIFGAAHAYQGPKQMFTIAILGCMLGWMAHWRKSLRPGIISHFLQDVVGGLSHFAH